MNTRRAAVGSAPFVSYRLPPMTQHDLLIGGAWVKGEGYHPNLNPSNLDESVGEYAHAGEAATRDAIAAARAAFPEWSKSNIQARADALDRAGTEILARREDLGRLLARAEGKTLKEGIGEVARAGNIFKFFAGEGPPLSGERV